MHVERAPTDSQVLQGLGIGQIRGVGHLGWIGREGSQASAAFASASSTLLALACSHRILSPRVGAVDGENIGLPAVSRHIRAEDAGGGGSGETPIGVRVAGIGGEGWRTIAAFDASRDQASIDASRS